MFWLRPSKIWLVKDHLKALGPFFDTSPSLRLKVKDKDGWCVGSYVWNQRKVEHRQSMTSCHSASFNVLKSTFCSFLGQTVHFKIKPNFPATSFSILFEVCLHYGALQGSALQIGKSTVSFAFRKHWSFLRRAMMETCRGGLWSLGLSQSPLAHRCAHWPSTEGNVNPALLHLCL